MSVSVSVSVTVSVSVSVSLSKCLCMCMCMCIKREALFLLNLKVLLNYTVKCGLLLIITAGLLVLTAAT